MKCPNCKKRIYIPKRYKHFPSAIWIFFGEHFGYPKCCIAYFTNNTVEEKRKCFKFAKNGYVPCPKCCNLLKKGGKIENLIKNRKCEKKY